MTIRLLQLTDLPLLSKSLNKNHIRESFGEPKDWLGEITSNLNDSTWIHYYIVEQDIPFGLFQYYETDKAPKGDWSDEPDGTVGINSNGTDYLY